MVYIGVETWAAVLEHKLKVIVRTTDPAQHGNLKKTFGALEMAMMETLERTDNNSNGAVVN